MNTDQSVATLALEDELLSGKQPWFHFVHHKYNTT
jgi:hypothetical protein